MVCDKIEKQGSPIFRRAFGIYKCREVSESSGKRACLLVAKSIYSQQTFRT